MNGLCLPGRPPEIRHRINQDGFAQDPAGVAGQAGRHVVAVVSYRDDDKAHLAGLQQVAHAAKLVSWDVIPEATHDGGSTGPFAVGRNPDAR